MLTMYKLGSIRSVYHFQIFMNKPAGRTLPYFSSNVSNYLLLYGSKFLYIVKNFFIIFVMTSVMTYRLQNILMASNLTAMSTKYLIYHGALKCKVFPGCPAVNSWSIFCSDLSICNQSFHLS